MRFAKSIFDRVLSSMTGRTCENVVGAEEARHIHQDDVTPGLGQVGESETHRQTIGRSPAGQVCFVAGQKIIYKKNNKNVKGEITAVHTDAGGAPYYVVELEDGRIIDTEQKNLEPAGYVLACFYKCCFNLHATILTHSIKQP